MRLIFTVTVLSIVIMSALGQHTDPSGNNHPSIHKIEVNEVIQTTSYTYIQARENGELQWIAIPKMEASVGETYYFHGGMEMRDFRSKELDRTFASILFLNGLISPELVEGGGTTINDPSRTSKPAEEMPEISVEPADGGISIAELFSNKGQYANKIVKIRGKVTKYNSGIMGRNWIHLQDGSGTERELDFTATSEEEVKVGDVVTLEGMITLDKDFGAGYFYEVIMENSRIVAPSN
jgi:hypothetical protein